MKSVILCEGGDDLFDPVDSIVIVRDRDDDSTPQILESMESWIGNNIRLENKTTSTLYREIDDCYVKTYFRAL